MSNMITAILFILVSVSIIASIVGQEHEQHRGGISGQTSLNRKSNILTEQKAMNRVVVVGSILLLLLLLWTYTMTA